MIIVILYFLHTLGNDQHTLVKRQLTDETDDRRRLKTKFVNGVEVVVRGNLRLLFTPLTNLSLISTSYFPSIYEWKVVVVKKGNVSVTLLQIK